MGLPTGCRASGNLSPFSQYYQIAAAVKLGLDFSNFWYLFIKNPLQFTH